MSSAKWLRVDKVKKEGMYLLADERFVLSSAVIVHIGEDVGKVLNMLFINHPDKPVRPVNHVENHRMWFFGPIFPPDDNDEYRFY